MIKVSDKVMIPQDHHPEINFMGLIIGPRQDIDEWLDFGHD